VDSDAFLPAVPECFSVSRNIPSARDCFKEPRFIKRIMRDMVRDCNVEVVMVAPTEFSTSQLARELGVYEQKIRQLDRRGILAPRRDIFGNRIFSVEDLRKGREYLASNKRG
jgi:hypothetical protein